MRHLPATALALLTAAGIIPACSSGNPEPAVPRRTAYYRLALPDSTYTATCCAGVSLDLNSSIDSLNIDPKGWITAGYPNSMATLYITVTPLTAATADREIDNRIERLSLNTGGAPTQITSFTTPGGLDTKIISTPAGTPTPVQFISTDHRSMMISGTARINAPDCAPADSVAPVIDMLQRDITRLTNSIAPCAQ